MWSLLLNSKHAHSLAIGSGASLWSHLGQRTQEIVLRDVCSGRFQRVCTAVVVASLGRACCVHKGEVLSPWLKQSWCARCIHAVFARHTASRVSSTRCNCPSASVLTSLCARTHVSVTTSARGFTTFCRPPWLTPCSADADASNNQLHPSSGELCSPRPQSHAFGPFEVLHPGGPTIGHTTTI